MGANSVDLSERFHIQDEASLEIGLFDWPCESPEFYVKWY